MVNSILPQLESAELNQLCQKYGISRLSLFGSFAHGTHTPSSDVDLLAEFETAHGMFTMLVLENELSELLGKPVDLVTKGALSPYLRERILDSMVIVYEA